MKKEFANNNENIAVLQISSPSQRESWFACTWRTCSARLSRRVL